MLINKLFLIYYLDTWNKLFKDLVLSRWLSLKICSLFYCVYSHRRNAFKNFFIIDIIKNIIILINKKCVNLDLFFKAAPLSIVQMFIYFLFFFNKFNKLEKEFHLFN